MKQNPSASWKKKNAKQNKNNKSINKKFIIRFSIIIWSHVEVIFSVNEKIKIIDFTSVRLIVVE
jgi:hypothetical protein